MVAAALDDGQLAYHCSLYAVEKTNLGSAEIGIVTKVLELGPVRLRDGRESSLKNSPCKWEEYLSDSASSSAPDTLLSYHGR